MRWEALFSDLEGWIAEQARSEIASEIADRTRREMARLRISDRLRAANGTGLVVGVEGVGQLAGPLARCGPDWLMLGASDGRRGDVLIALAAVTWVSGLSNEARDPQQLAVVDERWTLGYVMRGLARDRAGVQLQLRNNDVLAGTVDRVGADHVDIAEHPVGEPRRAREVLRTRVVRLAAIAAVMLV